MGTNRSGLRGTPEPHASPVAHAGPRVARRWQPWEHDQHRLPAQHPSVTDEEWWGYVRSTVRRVTR